MSTDSKSDQLRPGEVSQEQFDLLLSLTGLRGEMLIEALRGHLVGGLQAAEACRKCDISPSTLSTKLKHLRRISATVEALTKFYRRR